MMTNVFKSIGLMAGGKVISGAKPRITAFKSFVPTAFMLAYFLGLVFIAKIDNPEFMDKSLGFIDSVIRAHLYAFFKIATLNFNPIYIIAALYPFSLLVALFNWHLKAFFNYNPRYGSTKGEKFIVFWVVLAELSLVWSIVFISIFFLNVPLNIVDVEMFNQLMDTQEVKAFLK